MDWTKIILSLMTLISTGGWIVNHRKYKLDLSTEFAEKFRKLIVEPLGDEIEKLRNEEKELKDAIEGIYDCTYRDDCPVRKRMQRKSQRD